MGQPTFDILWKPPPELVKDKDNYRWFYRIVELLNGGLPGATTMLSVPVSENKTGATIRKGQLVGYAGVSNGTMDLRLFLADGSQAAFSVLGIASEDIEPNRTGYVVYYGNVTGINTSAWVPGTVLFASPTVAGGLTDVIPVPPNVRIVVGTVLTQSANGSIFVRIYPQLRPGYGAFFSTVAQSAVVGTNPTVKFQNSSAARGITINATFDEFTFETGGIYNVNATIQFGSTANQVITAVAWLQKFDGVSWANVPNSSREVAFSSTGTLLLAVLNYPIILNAGEKIRVLWGITDVRVTISLGPGNVTGTPAPAVDNTAVITLTQLNV